MSQHTKHGCDHIFFIGFLGAGKSTLARNVGTMFKRRFIDTDRLVVRRCGKSVTEIFETEGVKVLLTHIGGYPGRYAPGIASRLSLSKPKLMVCGHSHILKVIPDRARQVLVVNPGAAGRQGWQKVRTLVTLTLDNGSVTNCQIIELADDKQHPQGQVLD